MGTRRRVEGFAFPAGRRIAGKYEVEAFLGDGSEGEVYRVVELRTGIPRAAKVFYPERNERDRAVRFYAKKLERLRQCSIVVQYHHSESFWNRGERVTCLISELVEGNLLSRFVASWPGRRLPPFEALHLLRALASGLGQIHVKRQGVDFHVRLLDFYSWGRSDRSKIRDDVVQLIRLFYDVVGGRERYARQPPEIKAICCGLRQDLIVRKFPTAAHLRAHLDTFEWAPLP
jgi:serine/threonine protein kinase